jgi:hypothetical protein
MALVIALVAMALGSPTSKASPARAAIPHFTIHASAPMLPKQLTEGWVSLTLVNDTKSEASGQIASVNPGATLAQVATATAASQNSLAGYLRVLKLVTMIGGPENVPEGASETVVVDLWRPGLYGMPVNTNAGAHHVVIFNVTAGSRQPAAFPVPGSTLTLKDMKIIGLPKHLAAGTVTFQFTNTGSMVHELETVRLDAGKSQKDLLAFLESPQAQNGPPPAWAHDIGGLNAIAPRHGAELTLSFTPGYYVVFCAMPDVKKASGEPHFMEGMIGNFTVS